MTLDTSRRRLQSSSGVDIALHRLGGSGPPLLAVHGAGFHAHVWAPLVPDLASQFEVFGLDLRGHGCSRTPEHLELLRYEELAEDVARAASAIGTPCRIVAHSVGGAAVVLAETSRPGLFSACVLFEPIALPPTETEPGPAAAGARRRRRTFASEDAMVERLRSSGPLTGLDPGVLRSYVEHGVRRRTDGSVELRCAPEVEGAIYAADVQAPTWSRLPSFGPPTLLLGGEDRTSRRSRYLEDQAARMPRARVRRLPGASHLFPLERPTEMAAFTRAFLEEAQ